MVCDTVQAKETLKERGYIPEGAFFDWLLTADVAELSEAAQTADERASELRWRGIVMGRRSRFAPESRHRARLIRSEIRRRQGKKFDPPRNPRA